MRPLILASASPTRARLLRAAGVHFSVIPPDYDEQPYKRDAQRNGDSPRAVAEGLAAEKALAVPRPAGALVLGADQTLQLESDMIEKAATEDEVRQVLARLRGRAFQLHSAAALALDGVIIWRGVQSAHLRMRAFSDRFIGDYLARLANNLTGSLGGFAFEAEGAQLFDQVEGDHFAILGLPLLPLLEAFRRHGALEE